MKKEKSGKCRLLGWTRDPPRPWSRPCSVIHSRLYPDRVLLPSLSFGVACRGLYPPASNLRSFKELTPHSLSRDALLSLLKILRITFSSRPAVILSGAYRSHLLSISPKSRWGNINKIGGAFPTMHPYVPMQPMPGSTSHRANVIHIEMAWLRLESPFRWSEWLQSPSAVGRIALFCNFC